MILHCHFTLSIGLNGTQEATDHEVDVPENFHSLPEDERGEILHAAWKEWVWEYIDGSYDEI